MSLRESVCVSLNFHRIRNTFKKSFFRPIVTVDMKMIRSSNSSGLVLLFCHLSLNLVEQFRHRVLRNMPLELDRLSVDSVQFMTVPRIHEPSYFCLSSAVSNEDVRESFPDKAQNQNKRAPLLSTA